MQSSFAGSCSYHVCWATTTILGVCSRSDSCHAESYALQQGRWGCSRTGRTMHSTDRLAIFGHSICMCILVASNHGSLPDCRVKTRRRTRSWWTGASGRDATCNHRDLICERAGLFYLVCYACRHPHGNEGWINSIHLDTEDRWRVFAHTGRASSGQMRLAALPRSQGVLAVDG